LADLVREEQRRRAARGEPVPLTQSVRVPDTQPAPVPEKEEGVWLPSDNERHFATLLAAAVDRDKAKAIAKSAAPCVDHDSSTDWAVVVERPLWGSQPVEPSASTQSASQRQGSQGAVLSQSAALTAELLFGGDHPNTGDSDATFAFVFGECLVFNLFTWFFCRAAAERLEAEIGLKLTDIEDIFETSAMSQSWDGPPQNRPSLAEITSPVYGHTDDRRTSFGAEPLSLSAETTIACSGILPGTRLPRYSLWDDALFNSAFCPDTGLALPLMTDLLIGEDDSLSLDAVEPHEVLTMVSNVELSPIPESGAVDSDCAVLSAPPCDFNVQNEVCFQFAPRAPTLGSLLVSPSCPPDVSLHQKAFFSDPQDDPAKYSSPNFLTENTNRLTGLFSVSNWVPAAA
jgi:hypothetical protein